MRLEGLAIREEYFSQSDSHTITSNIGDEPRADISAQWDFERCKGLTT
jgi:hypothetical protein